MTQQLRKSDYLVGDCPLDQARVMVNRLHYAGGASNTATYLHGLYRRSDMKLCGVAWWIPPTKSCAASNWHDPHKVLSLSRLVIAPDVPKNAATFLLMRSAKLIEARRWPCLITHADTWRGHTGGIYKAAGWEDRGLSKPERVYTIDGRMVSRKAGPRTRTHSEMLKLGATCAGSFAKRRFRLVRLYRVRVMRLQVAEWPQLFATAP